MKKILGISLVALFAAAPMMAEAAPITKINAPAVQANTNVATTSYVKGAYKALADNIDTNIEAINKLNGDASESGSVANSIVAERSAAAALTSKTIDADSNTISNIETENFKGSAIAESISSNAVNTKLATEKAVADAIKDVNDAASSLASDVAANTSAITKLNGDAETNGSVAYAIAQEASARDTAIGTAINSEVTNRNNAIAAAVSGLDSTVSKAAGDDGLAITIVETDGKLASITASIASGTYDTAGAAAAAQTAAEGYADTAAASALQDAKDYADGLASGYETAGAAAAAQTAAEGYADTAAASALQSAKDYVDAKSLAVTTTWGTEATSAIQFSALNPSQEG